MMSGRPKKQQPLPPIADSGLCPHCGHIAWSGGPATESEFPLTCRICEGSIPRPTA